ncbi:MAG: aminodeoxychorismate synthase component I [Bacillota bacterium]
MSPFLLKKVNIRPDVTALFERFQGLPGSILLHSGMIISGLSRYSFIAVDPFLTITSKGEEVTIKRNAGPGSGESERKEGNPLDIIGELLKKYSMTEIQSPVPFIGGAAGFFSYDLGRRIEKLPELARDDSGVPDCWLGFYDVVAAVDNVAGEVYITSTGYPEEDPVRSEKRARQRADWLERELAAVLEKSVPVEKDVNYHLGMEMAGDNISGMISDFSRESYCAVVERAREYIAAGDIFQVNLSQRFQLPRKGDPWEVFKTLNKINPAPMAAFINCGDIQVVSASPERFIKLAGGSVETRPIKGTRPRGRSPGEDSRLREALWNSEKDRAELVMIVDLERNDLGRVCAPGSVIVPELYRIEEYPTVFHLVSTVTGKLEEGKGSIDLLKASFPGGSITGAPKIRAMEIIEELEPVRRGIYCGSIGYLSYCGEADLSIVIRTLVYTGDNIHLQVGGGLTIDSDPLSEYIETLDKARALINALRMEGVLV